MTGQGRRNGGEPERDTEEHDRVDQGAGDDGERSPTSTCGYRPQDAGGITSDPDSPIRRCRACMWRWPCPTFKTIDEALER